jgi:hypothetical protein
VVEAQLEGTWFLSFKPCRHRSFHNVVTYVDQLLIEILLSCPIRKYMIIIHGHVCNVY